MSGRKITDHSSWVGKAGHGHVFPDGPHKVKMESSDSHSGELHHYEDTTEAIKSQQEHNAKKIRGHAQKPGHRN